MGKRKIRIERIEKQEYKYATFSKRRKGLFGKASKLEEVCNAQAAMVIFSPAGRPYTFASQGLSLDVLIQRYLEKHRANEVEKQDTDFWFKQVELDNFSSMEDLRSLKNRLELLRENICSRSKPMTVSASHAMGAEYLALSRSSSSSSCQDTDIFEALTGENIYGVQPESSSPSLDEDLTDFFADLPEMCSAEYLALSRSSSSTSCQDSDVFEAFSGENIYGVQPESSSPSLDEDLTDFFADLPELCSAEYLALSRSSSPSSCQESDVFGALSGENIYGVQPESSSPSLDEDLTNFFAADLPELCSISSFL